MPSLPSFVRRMVPVTALAVALLLGQAAPAPAEPRGWVATIQTHKGRFRAVILDPAMAQLAQRELDGEGEAGIPNGPLAWGDDGVNRGHVWHITELSFAEVTIELCDGTARGVDREPTYWVETVGSFCPWSGEVVKLRALRH